MNRMGIFHRRLSDYISTKRHSSRRTRSFPSPVLPQTANIPESVLIFPVMNKCTAPRIMKRGKKKWEKRRKSHRRRRHGSSDNKGTFADLLCAILLLRWFAHCLAPAISPHALKLNGLFGRWNSIDNRMDRSAWHQKVRFIISAYTVKPRYTYSSIYVLSIYGLFFF
jgi:hypothetical protein